MLKENTKKLLEEKLVQGLYDLTLTEEEQEEEWIRLEESNLFKNLKELQTTVNEIKEKLSKKEIYKFNEIKQMEEKQLTAIKALGDILEILL